MIKYIDKYEYCLSIDMDEFFVSKKGLSLKDIIKYMKENNKHHVLFWHRCFENRFKNLDKKVMEIDASTGGELLCNGMKSLFKITSTLSLEMIKNKKVYCVHRIVSNICSSKEYLERGDFINKDDMMYNHYTGS